MGQFQRECIDYQQALALEPELDYAEGFRLAAKLYLCDWTNLEAETAHLLSGLRKGKAVSVPFVLLPIASTPADQLQCAERYMQDFPIQPPLWQGDVYSHDRIRIAYLSADFRDHAVAHLTAGLFEGHDKSRFEITGISIGPAQESALRRRLKDAFARFIDAERESDEEIANLVRKHQIDIAVDLIGMPRFTPGILACRPAPIQVHFIGYAGTLGTKCIDYLIANSTVVPEEHRSFYTEQVIRLPDTYLAGDDKRVISPRTPRAPGRVWLPRKQDLFSALSTTLTKSGRKCSSFG